MSVDLTYISREIWNFLHGLSNFLVSLLTPYKWIWVLNYGCTSQGNWWIKIGYGSRTAICLFVIGLEGKVLIISGCGVRNINPMDKILKAGTN